MGPIEAFSCSDQPLYLLACPRGTEEVARAELESVARRVLSHSRTTKAASPAIELGIQIWSSPPSVKGLGAPLPPREHPTPDQRVDWKRQRAQSPSAPNSSELRPVPAAAEDRSLEDAAKQLRGAVLFHLDDLVWDERRRARLFLALFGVARTIELCAQHVLTVPCRDVVSALDPPIRAAAHLVHHAVMHDVSGLRRAMGSLATESPDGEAEQLHLLGPSYTQPLTDASVRFRVQCVRREKTVPCGFSSQDIAVQAGDSLMECFEEKGWGVSMVYHNLEVFVVHDEGVAHICVVLSPPALPRCGSDTIVSAQFFMELVRQRLTRGLVDGTYTAAELKALIPRPSSHRVELRQHKGENAMHPALARTLLAFAALEGGMVVLDPFVGCGTVLVEAAASSLCTHRQSLDKASAASHSHGLVLLGGECSTKDAWRTANNLQLPALLSLSAGHGCLPLSGDSPRTRTARQAVADWAAQIAEDAAALDIRTGLEVAKPLEATQAQRERLATVVRAATAEPVLAGAYVFTSFLGDATHIPLRNNTVDRIVTDMPFGRRCGSHAVNRLLYPRFLRECHRVLRRPTSANTDVGDLERSHRATPWLIDAADPHRLARCCALAQRSVAGRAVLLTIEGRLLYESLAEIQSECPFQLVTEPFAVDMGGLFPYVFVLDKL